MYIVNPVVSHEGLAGRCEPSWGRSMCHVDRLFLPLFHFYMSNMYVGRAEYTES
jgi:hypothetical protein